MENDTKQTDVAADTKTPWDDLTTAQAIDSKEIEKKIDYSTVGGSYFYEDSKDIDSFLSEIENDYNYKIEPYELSPGEKDVLKKFDSVDPSYYFNYQWAGEEDPLERPLEEIIEEIKELDSRGELEDGHSVDKYIEMARICKSEEGGVNWDVYPIESLDAVLRSADSLIGTEVEFVMACKDAENAYLISFMWDREDLEWKLEHEAEDEGDDDEEEYYEYGNETEDDEEDEYGDPTSYGER